MQAQIANSMDSLSSLRKDESDNASELIGLEVLDSLLRDSFLKQLFSQFFEILREATEPLPANLAVSSAHAIPLTVIIHTRLTALTRLSSVRRAGLRTAVQLPALSLLVLLAIQN